jgi:hypothetical protein
MYKTHYNKPNKHSVINSGMLETDRIYNVAEPD